MKYLRNLFSRTRCLQCKGKIKMFAHTDLLTRTGISTFCDDTCRDIYVLVYS